jgi:hypothetical protein
MEILSKIFGSEAKVKIMRLFLFNPEQPFSSDDIANRAKISEAVARHETAILRKMGMVKGRRFNHTVSVRKGKIFVTKKKSVGGWVLNDSFPYLTALKDLLINTVLFNRNDILRRLNAVGKMKLVIVAGVFIKDTDSRVDLLVVGDNIRFSALGNVIKCIESEIGKELRYAAFETKDFEYRFDMYDKLIRDILDYPNKKILNKLNNEFLTL